MVVTYKIGPSNYNQVMHRVVAETYMPMYDPHRMVRFRAGSDKYNFTADDLYQRLPNNPNKPRPRRKFRPNKVTARN